MKKSELIKIIKEEIEKKLLSENPQLQLAAQQKARQFREQFDIMVESYTNPDTEFPSRLGTADKIMKNRANLVRQRLEEFLKIVGGGQL